jgi:hypothetical protein
MHYLAGAPIQQPFFLGLLAADIDGIDSHTRGSLRCVFFTQVIKIAQPAAINAKSPNKNLI